MTDITLTFHESAAEYVVESFGREVDSEGYIVDPETGERETTPEGNPVKIDEFAGIEKGSEIFLDDDFETLVQHIKRRRES